MSAIARPFGILLMWLYDISQSYGIAIMLFAMIVRLIMLPFQMKSKRGMMRMTLLNPQIQDLQKRYASNPQKAQEETMKLYQQEGVNPMSGCLWGLLPFPIMIALYEAIRQPLTTMMGVSKELIAEGGSILAKLTELGFESPARSGYAQIAMSKFISEHFSEFEALSSNLRQINYKFLGIDLGSTPDYKIWNYNWGNKEELLPALGLFMIPVVATLLTYLTSWVSQKMNPSAAQSPETAATTSSMNLIMPLMTLWFTFIMPAGLGFYWAVGSVLSIVQEIVLTKHYSKALASETAEWEEHRRQREAELEAKRQETERKRAMNATTENENTSKKKREAKEAAERAKRQAEWERAQSGEEEAYEPSRVGHRKYARGRAYDPDRYTKNSEDGNTEPNPDTDSDGDSQED